MYVTVTLNMYNGSFDIQADDNLPILRAIRVLAEHLGTQPVNSEFCRLDLQERVVSVYDTFSQAGIRGGDILSVAI